MNALPFAFMFIHQFNAEVERRQDVRHAVQDVRHACLQGLHGEGVVGAGTDGDHSSTDNARLVFKNFL